MKPPQFRYHEPRELDVACELLAKLDNAKILAGGQSLLPMLNMRLVFPDDVVDINHVAALSFVREHAGRIEIGAMTRQRELERCALIAERCPIMVEALTHVGHRQTRNRGTLGGSLCHLDPAAELPAVAMVLDATLRVRSVRGERTIPMAKLPAFYMTPSIEADEILTSVEFEPWPAAHGYAFVEYARRHGDFAIVAVAVMMEVDAGGSITRARICVGGVSTGPLQCTEIEDAIVGARGADEVFEQATRWCAGIDAMEDVHASKDYRRHLAQVLCARALASAYTRATQAR